MPENVDDHAITKRSKESGRSVTKKTVGPKRQGKRKRIWVYIGIRTNNLPSNLPKHLKIGEVTLKSPPWWGPQREVWTSAHL